MHSSNQFALKGLVQIDTSCLIHFDAAIHGIDSIKALIREFGWLVIMSSIPVSAFAGLDSVETVGNNWAE